MKNKTDETLAMLLGMWISGLISDDLLPWSGESPEGQNDDFQPESSPILEDFDPDTFGCDGEG